MGRREIDQEIRAMLKAGGPAQRIRQLEQERGHHIIEVGVVFPIALSAQDWRRDSVVSLNRAAKEIRIVLVNARTPGKGAFSRLVKTIKAAGFTPVVVSAMGKTMPAILERWGWVEDGGEWREPNGVPDAAPARTPR